MTLAFAIPVLATERLGARFERADPGRVKPFHAYRHPGVEVRP